MPEFAFTLEILNAPSCGAAARSALAAVVLKEMGYTNAKNMLGAFKAYGEAGYLIYNMHGEFTMVAFEKKE